MMMFEYGYGNRDVIKTIIKDFQRRFTTDNNVRIKERVPFSRDIDDAVSDHEILEGVKQLLSLKLSGQKTFGVSSTRNFVLLWVNQLVI